MSGHYTPLLVSLGIASCALATVLAHLIGASDDEGLPLHIFARLPAYLVWLIREIITANIATARIILSGSARPVLFTTKATQTTAAGVATYANSITLTPGTVADGMGVIPNEVPALMKIEHPQGIIEVLVDYAHGADGFQMKSAGLVRTARLLAKGAVMVPGALLEGHA